MFNHTCTESHSESWLSFIKCSWLSDNEDLFIFIFMDDDPAVTKLPDDDEEEDEEEEAMEDAGMKNVGSKNPALAR